MFLLLLHWNSDKNISLWVLVFFYRFYFNKNAYLKSNWNRLDFTIVTMAVLDNYTDLKNFSIIRNYRILNPLRSIVKF